MASAPSLRLCVFYGISCFDTAHEETKTCYVCKHGDKFDFNDLSKDTLNTNYFLTRKCRSFELIKIMIRKINSDLINSRIILQMSCLGVEINAPFFIPRSTIVIVATTIFIGSF